MAGRHSQTTHAAGHLASEVPSNTEKDPSTWTTGGEPMTGAQKSYLTTLSEEAGQPVDENLSKAEASHQIDALRKTNPRTNGD